jgi:hypothetical protein
MFPHRIRLKERKGQCLEGAWWGGLWEGGCKKDRRMDMKEEEV